MATFFAQLANDCALLVAQSCPTLHYPHGLQPTRLLCPCDSPGKNTGVGSLFFSPGDIPDRGIKPGSPSLQADSSPAELPAND